MTRHFLILGTGSVGKRHARNLKAEGCSISIMDTREDRRAETAAELPVLGSYGSLAEALGKATFDGVVIASPPSVHVTQVLASLERKLPVFLEKPLCPSLEHARALPAALAASGVPLVLGYTWRWWPPINDVRTLLAQNAIGSLRHVRFLLSAHLADWHPWERYQDFFMASKALGGGALLDESHWVDLMLYFFGMPRDVFARVEKISDLEIDTDDNVDLLFSYDGFRVAMHLDLFGRPHQKSITFSGENGSMLWSETPNRISIETDAVATGAKDRNYDCQRNDMFVGAMREFLSLVSGTGLAPRCTLQDGLNVLKVLEAARRSSDEGRVVALAGLV